jgi:uncharacterized protein YcbK (DUF882 family)
LILTEQLPPAPGAADLKIPSRRRFLCAAAAFTATIPFPRSALASDFWSLPRELWLYRKDTGETVREVYWADGQLQPEGYIRICQLLRDVRMNQAVQFDLVTLDIARGVTGWLAGFGIPRPLIILSGYRHPATNARTEGAARNSLHTLAQAIDFRIEGVSAEAVGKFGMYLSAGGVGFYPGSNFTHLDRGRVRTWRG